MSEEQSKNSTEPQNPQQKQDVAVADKSSAGENSRKETKEAPAQHKRRARKHKTPGWGVIAIIALTLIAAAAWFGHSEFNKTQQSFNDIQQSQTALTRQNREFEAKLLARMEAMQAQQKELTDYIQVLREKNQHLRKDWLVMEAEYLIQLANYRLLFERDINTAVAALESADDRLRETGDPGILSVRKVIAESVQALKQIPQADLAGLSLTLSAINKDIEKLSLSTPDPKSKQHEQELAQSEQQTKKVESWSELPAAVWSDLKSLIVIRDHETPIQPLLSPEERFFLVENLRLQIEQARLAMLSGQTKVFEERLATAVAWIEKHFDKESAVTKSMLDALKQIQSQSIAPELPDISATYQALRNYRLGREPGPAKPKTEKPTSPKPEVETPKQPEVQSAPAAPAPADNAKPVSDGGAS